jgi:hypothetical protein
METRRKAERNATRIADNDVRASGTSGIFSSQLRSRLSSTRMGMEMTMPRPALQAVVLTRDLIAERARTIWLERGCSPDRDEENWREAEAQLKTELGIG